MAFAWTDGFDSYAATSDLTKKYASAAAGWAWNATAGRTGAGGIVATGSSQVALTSPASLPTNNYRGGGFYMKLSAAPTSNTTIFQEVYSTGGTTESTIIVTTAGVISMNAMGAVIVTGTTAVADNNWHWIEWRVNYAGASATGGLYVDGILQGTATGLLNSNYSLDHFQFLSVPNQTLTIDDVVLYNDNSGAPTMSGSFPLGPRQITTIRPASDGTCTFGTLSSGTAHYALVNETNPDGDTSWVSDGTSGDQDLYNYGALGYTPLNITAVMVNNYLKNPNAGSINFETACKSGSTTTLGASTLTPSSYQTSQTPFPTDPNTSAAWLAAGLNSAQFGIKVP